MSNHHSALLCFAGLAALVGCQDPSDASLGAVFYSAGPDAQFRVDVSSKAITDVTPLPQPGLQAITSLPDGSRVASVAGNTTFIQDSSGAHAIDPPTESGYFPPVWGPQGYLLYSISRSGAVLPVIVAAGEYVGRVLDSDGQYAINSDGTVLCYSSSAHALEIENPVGSSSIEVAGVNPNGMTFAHGGQFLVTGTGSGADAKVVKVDLGSHVVSDVATGFLMPTFGDSSEDDEVLVGTADGLVSTNVVTMESKVIVANSTVPTSFGYSAVLSKGQFVYSVQSAGAASVHVVTDGRDEIAASGSNNGVCQPVQVFGDRIASLCGIGLVVYDFGLHKQVFESHYLQFGGMGPEGFVVTPDPGALAFVDYEGSVTTLAPSAGFISYAYDAR